MDPNYYLLERTDRDTPPEGEQKDILSMEVSRGDVRESYYRILIGDKVKYLEIMPGIFGEDTLRRPPNLFAVLPTLPHADGGWVGARITGTRPENVELSYRELRAVKDVWHPARFDILTLKNVRKLSNRAYEVTHPSKGGNMIAKYARFDFEINMIDNETRIYRMINDRGIGPEFLGHIHEHGRIIGFALRKIYTGRLAEPQDLPACTETLKKLHCLKILHTALKIEDFVVTGGENGEALLIDFENSKFLGGGGSRELLQKEMNYLPKIFNSS